MSRTEYDTLYHNELTRKRHEQIKIYANNLLPHLKRFTEDHRGEKNKDTNALELQWMLHDIEELQRLLHDEAYNIFVITGGKLQRETAELNAHI